MRTFIRLVVVCTASILIAGVGLLAAPASTAAGTAAADQAWEALTKSSQPPRPPESWQSSRPSQADIDQFKSTEGARLAKAAESAKDFQAQFPNDSRAEKAGTMEYDLLQQAAQLGNTNVSARLDKLEEAKLQNPKTSENQRFEIRAGAVERRAVSKTPEGMDAVLAEFEKGARSLLKDFPNRPEPYQMLFQVASEAGPDQARRIAKDLAGSSAPAQIKSGAKAILAKMELVGKPLPIKFTAVDGRPVDLAKLKGKVVLVDFWATWCGPCIGELPNVRAAYEKLHPKGFEIVGISFDREKDKLLTFVKEQKMTWPQYFDGKQWENDYGRQFGIQSIPAMWLVDKKGNLRDLNAREGLADRVEKLLAENP